MVERFARIACEHGYGLTGDAQPCGCRPVICAVCLKQMFYDGDPRHEPESMIHKSGSFADRYIHDACIGVPATPEVSPEGCCECACHVGGVLCPTCKCAGYFEPNAVLDSSIVDVTNQQVAGRSL